MSLNTHDPARGERIRAAREARGWSQQDLADAVGAALRTVGSWERGGPIKSHAGALEELLGIPLRGSSARLDDATDQELAAELLDRNAQLRDRVRVLEQKLAGHDPRPADD